MPPQRVTDSWLRSPGLRLAAAVAWRRSVPGHRRQGPEGPVGGGNVLRWARIKKIRDLRNSQPLINTAESCYLVGLLKVLELSRKWKAGQWVQQTPPERVPAMQPGGVGSREGYA